MLHVFFMVLHLLAILFGVVGLVVTIPLHIIFTALHDFAMFITTRDCPYCGKQVKNEANKCPYCQEWLPEKKK